MTVIGVTGTDGKTTTTHLIYHVLVASGKKVSMISTVEAIINGHKYDTGFHVTTPSPFFLQKIMREALNGGSKYFVLETTSHALDQYRIFGSSVDIAVFTNINHEHLDYHGSLLKYSEAKAKLLNGVQTAVLNADDSSYEFLKKRLKGKIITYGINQPSDINQNKLNLKPKIQGEYNLYNCLAAASVGLLFKITHSEIKKSIADFTGIAGRLEEIDSEKDYQIFIDFAHKPNALNSVLKTLRNKTHGRLIVIFGCAGLRDHLKRPMMGEIAAKIADLVILTAEDPRTEDVRDIIEDIASGCLKAEAIELNRNQHDSIKMHHKYFFRIPDRQEAINFVIRKLAKSGDIVLIAGKGHEKSMCYGNTEYPWDEKSAIGKALNGSI